MPEGPKNTSKRIQRLLREALTLTKSLPAADAVQDAGADYGTHHPSRFHVERYGGTRFWGLYEGDELLAVTVYRKGAEAVRNRLQEQEAKIAWLSQAPPGQEPEGSERPGAVERLQAERQSGRKRQR
jgi:hypothetical protein